MYVIIIHKSSRCNPKCIGGGGDIMKGKCVAVRQIMLGDGTPRICIPLMAANRKELDTELMQILAGPCDLIEWRADVYRETQQEHWITETLSYLRERVGQLPILFTFRTKEEGGERSVSAAEYRSMNLEAAQSGNADLIDLEWNRGSDYIAEIITLAHEAGIKVIASFHDFRRTPDKERLLDIIYGMQEIGADLTKAAVMPRSEKDVLTLLDLSITLKETADRPYITMSMSRTGAVSRLCGALTGSAITFAAAGKASAPGQMDAEFVKSVLGVL